jgi:hypothetical protein
MKNRDENTTIIQFSYRAFTIFKTFFSFSFKDLLNKKAPEGAPENNVRTTQKDINKTTSPARN